VILTAKANVFTFTFLLFPETNTPLEEVAEIFEGYDALANGGMKLSKIKVET